jgi:protein-disulfide isomerase
MRAAVALALLGGCAAASSSTRERELEARLARSEAQLTALTERFSRAGRLPRPAPDPAVTYAVAVGPHDLVEGPADAKVTLIEAYEFLCPYCRRVDPTVQALRAKYGNDLRVVSKYLVIHGTEAVAPALLACAAHKQGQLAPARAALWDTLFDDQLGVIEAHTATPHLITTVAGATGLDPAMLAADAGLLGDEFGPSSCMQWIQDSIDQLDGFEVSATPAFFVNGRYLSGAHQRGTFERLIDEELAKATAAIERGVPAADYYASEIVGKGATEVRDALSELEDDEAE